MPTSPHRRCIAPPMLAAAAALLLVTACSGGDDGSPATTSNAVSSVPGSPTTTAEAAAEITMKGFTFSPADLTVRAGQKVTVFNDDSAAHTVTATEGKAFDTGDIGGGTTGTFTAPSKAGSYAFICTYHPSMEGTLIVR